MRRALAALLVPSAVGLVAPLWATHTAIGFTAGASGAAAVYPVDFPVAPPDEDASYAPPA